MIDTLMALWNQDRRKRAMQIVLTFLLMCIGISLLFVITDRSVESQHQHQKASQGDANPTIPPFGNTVVPNLTPTVSVVVGTQTTPVATTQPTPIATTTQPCAATPTSATSRTSSLYANILVQQTASPTPTLTFQRGSGMPGVSIKHFDGGGGPISTSTPVLPTPTTIGSYGTPVPPHVGGGWVPSCDTSNSISIITDSNVIALLKRNIWLILGCSFLGTMLFYGMIFAVKRRIRV